MDDKKHYLTLIQQVQYYSDLYYNQDESKIDDYRFDMMMQELKQLEKDHPTWVQPDSPTQQVGGKAKREAGVLVPHRVPMLSLQDVFSKEEVDAFVLEMQEKVSDPTFVVEYKIDGLSLCLRYVNGVLERAITRGDGITQGEDVTENAKMIRDVKQKLPDPIPYLEIRGEVYMTAKAFTKVNEMQELQGKKLFANPRNCAAGTLRQLDSSIVKERDLSMFIFNIQDSKGIDIDSHSAGYTFLQKQGIPIIEEYQICKTKEEVWQAITSIQQKRATLGYDIDGAVVKVDRFADRNKLGSTAKVPKWAIAYKYPPEEKETVLRDIELSVGRTGRITPKALFDSVRLCGTNVARATLHNQDFIDALDIRIGDHIVVYKSGEIIPKVKEVLLDKRPEKTEPYRIPNHCPVCGAKVIQEKESADIKCKNPTCPSKLLKNVINFASRDAMDIKGFGVANSKALIDGGYIKDMSDIYTLHTKRDALLENKVIGLEKSTDKLLQAIEVSKQNDGTRLLTSLGIANVGKTAAKSLMQKFQSIENIMQASLAQLLSVHDIGETSAMSISEYFRDERNKEVICRLHDYGVNTKSLQVQDGVLVDKTFVITGTLPTLSRKEAAALIESHGGKVASSVTKKTDYLVAGENAGSKLTKAEELHITIIDEIRLQQMVKEV